MSYCIQCLAHTADDCVCGLRVREEDVADSYRLSRALEAAARAGYGERESALRQSRDLLRAIAVRIGVTL